MAIFHQMTQILKLKTQRFFNVLKTIFALGILGLLTACPAPGPECVMADDWGQHEDVTVSVSARNEYTFAGIEVMAGEPLRMEVSGFVDLCPANRVLDENSTNNRISPQVNKWQSSGFSVTEGDYFSIFVKDHNSEETPNSSSYVDRRGQPLRGGKGLYALILPPGKVPTEAQESRSFWANPTIEKDPEFFELWENDPKNNKGSGSGIGGFSGIAPIDGVIWFKYARTAADGKGTRVYSNSGNWEERWNPWRGRYAWHDKHCPLTCAPGSFIPICYATLLTAADPLCVLPQYATCGRKKMLPDQYKCKWTPSDHWVEEDYKDNVNGYEINVSVGCPGDRGKYLEMLIVQESDMAGEERPAFKPSGCIPGDGGCRPQVDGNGSPITKTDYTVKPNRNIFTMSMDPIDNSMINSNAQYDGKVGRSGQLWFKIVDKKVKSDDKLATPPGCDIPTSSNYIAPSNDPANCVQRVHPEANPGDKQCFRDYITNESGNRVRDAKACGITLLEDVRNQLADQPGGNENTYVYIPACGYKNLQCLPPKGYTGHEDNLGEYKVRIKTTKVGNGFSSAMMAIVKPVKKILYGVCVSDDSLREVACNEQYGRGDWKPGIVKRMYTKLIGTTEGGSNPFVGSVRAGLLLFVVLYGLQFMLGMIKEPQRDFMWNIVRIAFIQQMLSPTSWEFFNEYLFTLFIDGINELISIMAGQLMMGGSVDLVDPITGQIITNEQNMPVRVDVDNPFTFFDHTITRFFSQETWIKLAGLLASSPVGWLYILVIMVGMWFYVMAVLVALILYLLALVGIGLLVIVAPIFISFVLFKRTRILFSNWIESLMSLMLQPVLVFTALSIFNIFIYSAIYTMLHFSVCWQCAINIDHDWGLFDVKFCLFKFYLPWEEGVAISTPVQFFVIIIFIILANALYHFNEWMAKLAAELTTGRSDVNLFNTAKNAFDTTKWMGASVGSMGLSLGGKMIGTFIPKKKKDEKDNKKDEGSDAKKDSK